MVTLASAGNTSIYFGTGSDGADFMNEAADVTAATTAMTNDESASPPPPLILNSIVQSPGIRFEVYFLTTVCFLGFIGNALVLVVYSNKKHRRSNAGLYVLNLAVGK